MEPMTGIIAVASGECKVQILQQDAHGTLADPPGVMTASREQDIGLTPPWRA
jgi:hypothetical protein